MGLIAVSVLILGLTSLAAGQYNYGQVLGYSFLFYEAQRTGRLPANNRIPWRGDSFYTDSGINGEDLSGGYFDAGDFVKFGFPAASAIGNLAWSLVDSRAGYQAAGQLDNALAALRWGLDYFIKIHPSANVLYVQVGDAVEDHSAWGRPEDWTGSNPRPTLRATTALPATEVAASTAAALAAGYIVFSVSGETAYANTLLTHATQLFSFADTYRGHYNNSFPSVIDYYNSWSGYGDELLWGAAWLYRATGQATYQAAYQRFWTEFGLNSRPSEASWDTKQAQAQILLARIDGSAQYVNAARDFCDWLVSGAPRTPRGLVFLSEWGSLRHAANVAYLCLAAADAGINPAAYRAFAKQQIDYALGDGGRSFVVGFGVNPPTQPHHAAASCPNRPATCTWTNFHAAGPNPQVITGALIGGPDINDVFVDNRADYVQNEVTIDYNALWTGSLAEIIRLGY